MANYQDTFNNCNVHYMVLADDGDEYGPFNLELLSEYAGEQRLVPTTRLRNPEGMIVTASEVLNYWDRSTPESPVAHREPSFVKQTLNPENPVVAPLRYASLANRLAAAVVDLIFLATIDVVVFVSYLISPSRLLERDVINLIVIGNYVLTALFYVFLSATPGKRILGLHIVSLDGNKPTLWQVLGRTAAAYMYCVPSLLGLFSGPNHRTLAEKWAGTVTISNK